MLRTIAAFLTRRVSVPVWLLFALPGVGALLPLIL